MSANPRRFLVATALLALVAPLVGLLPAAAVGTGNPVILSPVEYVYAGQPTDLQVDFAAAPYGTYAWSVTRAGSGSVVVSGDVVHDAEAAPKQVLTRFTVPAGEYVATVRDDVSGASDTVTFGTVELGEPPRSCEIDLPSKVVVTAATTAIWPRFSGCQGVTQTWYVGNRAGRTYGTFRIVNGVSRGAWRFRDSFPYGGYQVWPKAAAGLDGPAANSTRMVIKVGSRLSLTAGPRQGDRVRLSGIASRYSSTADAYRRWASRPVAISYRDCSSCAWKFLGMDATNRYGGFDLTVVSTKTRYYRAKVGETGTSWGRTSKPVRR